VSIDPLIRVATAEDAAGLTGLAHRAKASWGYSAEWLEVWRDQLTIAADYIKQQRVFVATVAGQVAGCCALEDLGIDWELAHLWVDPAFQRRGIGRLLVRHALGVAAATRPGLVRVQADPNAMEFYRRLGASVIRSSPAPMPGAPERELPELCFMLPRRPPQS
jgi:ribosomal protein S18 acetylase RimI-like enzyme